MRFGAHVSADNLKEVTWPDEALPAGTFGSIAEVMSGGKRIVLASFEKNEPILRSKITGPGQKATLSAVIQDGMRAVTVRVNDVEGVGGFVLPGDHVDVLLTRQQERANGTNDVVIQNARVLAVDQLADDAADRPTVVKAVTLEVDTVAAQKIAVADAAPRRRAGDGRYTPRHHQRSQSDRNDPACAGSEALRQGVGHARNDQAGIQRCVRRSRRARRRRRAGGTPLKLRGWGHGERTAARVAP